MYVCLFIKNDLVMLLIIFINFNIEYFVEFLWNVKLFISSKCFKYF